MIFKQYIGKYIQANWLNYINYWSSVNIDIVIFIEFVLQVNLLLLVVAVYT